MSDFAIQLLRYRQRRSVRSRSSRMIAVGETVVVQRSCEARGQAEAVLSFSSQKAFIHSLLCIVSGVDELEDAADEALDESQSPKRSRVRAHRVRSGATARGSPDA